MTATNFPESLAFTLAAEGGFADNPADPGGATMKGVTLATFQKFVPGASVADLRAIPDFAVSFIYWSGYWHVTHCDNLPSGVDLSVFDFAVNAGPGRSIEMLQQAVGAEADGDLGPLSMAAIHEHAPLDIVNELAKLQTTYYQELPTFPTFGRGWISRTVARSQAATKMATQQGTSA